MNMYRTVPPGPRRWGIEWRIDDRTPGLMVGTFDNEAEAAFRVYELARMEMEEAPRE